MKASQTFCVSLLACTWHSQSPGTHGSFETPYSHAYLFSNLFFPRLLGLLLVPSAVPGPTLLRPAAVPIKAFSKNPWKRPQPWECPVLEGATRQTHTHNHSSWEMKFLTAPSGTRNQHPKLGHCPHGHVMWGMVGHSTLTRNQQFLSSPRFLLLF